VTSDHARRCARHWSCLIPVSTVGRGVGFKRGNCPGSSMRVRCDGPDRNASTSCSGNVGPCDEDGGGGMFAGAAGGCTVVTAGGGGGGMGLLVLSGIGCERCTFVVRCGWGAGNDRLVSAGGGCMLCVPTLGRGFNEGGGMPASRPGENGGPDIAL